MSSTEERELASQLTQTNAARCDDRDRFPRAREKSLCRELYCSTLIGRFGAALTLAYHAHDLGDQRSIYEENIALYERLIAEGELDSTRKLTEPPKV